MSNTESIREWSINETTRFIYIQNYDWAWGLASKEDKFTCRNRAVEIVDCLFSHLCSEMEKIPNPYKFSKNPCLMMRESEAQRKRFKAFEAGRKACIKEMTK